MTLTTNEAARHWWVINDDSLILSTLSHHLPQRAVLQCFLDLAFSSLRRLIPASRVALSKKSQTTDHQASRGIHSMGRWACWQLLLCKNTPHTHRPPSIKELQIQTGWAIWRIVFGLQLIILYALQHNYTQSYDSIKLLVKLYKHKYSAYTMN